MQKEPNKIKMFPPKVVGSVTTLEDWQSCVSRDVSQECDWLEVRLDTFPSHISAEELMAAPPAVPVLATARCTEEGGKREMPESERLALLEQYVPYVQAIDIEIARMDGAAELIAKAKEAGVLIVASAHDFEKTPELAYLLKLEKEARGKGADIVKFAFMLKHADHLLTGIRLLEQASGKVSVMGMGALGSTSRLLYSQLGSCLIYGFMGEYAAAPGQWPAKAFNDALKMMLPAGE